MNKILILAIHSILVIGISGCESASTPPPETAEKNEVMTQICSDEWYALVEKKVITDDGLGHGPGLGSMEWRYVIESHLKIKDNTDLPPCDSEQWCHYINKKLIGKTN